jgi:hypothetical protein
MASFFIGESFLNLFLLFSAQEKLNSEQIASRNIANAAGFSLPYVPQPETANGGLEHNDIEWIK